MSLDKYDIGLISILTIFSIGQIASILFDLPDIVAVISPAIIAAALIGYLLFFEPPR